MLFNFIINVKNFHDQAIDSDIKQYEEIKKWTTTQDEDYTTGCLLDYDYINNYYRLIGFDLSGQKELDADPKTIQQIEIVENLKTPVNEIVANELMIVLTIFEKIKETKLTFSQWSVTVF